MNNKDEDALTQCIVFNIFNLFYRNIFTLSLCYLNYLLNFLNTQLNS